MSTIELSQFTLREKFEIMQSIWDELRGTVDSFEVPQSHKDILDARRCRVERGESKLLDWEQVKHTIGKFCYHHQGRHRSLEDNCGYPPTRLS